MVPFVNSEEMAQSSGVADIVVSRAGATTFRADFGPPLALITRMGYGTIELHSFCSSVDQNANPLPAKAAANLS